MADPLSQFSMLGSGFNSQLVSNPNAAGSSQQQSPSDSMQPIGGLPNPEHSRMWMQLQQQVNQQRTTPSGDIVGSQVTWNSFFVTTLSLSCFSLLPFFPFLSSHPFFSASRPSSYFFSPSLPGTALRQTLAFSLLGFAYVSSDFCYVSHLATPLTNRLLNSQLIFLSFRWLVNNRCSVRPFPPVQAQTCNITISSASSKTTEP